MYIQFLYLYKTIFLYIVVSGGERNGRARHYIVCLFVACLFGLWIFKEILLTVQLSWNHFFSYVFCFTVRWITQLFHIVNPATYALCIFSTLLYFMHWFLPHCPLCQSYRTFFQSLCENSRTLTGHNWYAHIVPVKHGFYLLLLLKTHGMMDCSFVVLSWVVFDMLVK